MDARVTPGHDRNEFQVALLTHSNIALSSRPDMNRAILCHLTVMPGLDRNEFQVALLTHSNIALSSRPDMNRAILCHLTVMPGLDPGIHIFQAAISSNKSRHSELFFSIKAIFHSRLQCLMFFSR